MSPRGALAAALLSWTALPSTADAVASAELFKIQPEVYGRFEARIRYAPGEGVVSSFFLWKEGSEVAGTFWNELDFEKLEGVCRMQTNTLYGNPVMGAEQSHTMPADMCDAYHDYAFEWTPEAIAWFIDGREIRRVTGAPAQAFAQNASGGMRIHFNVWPGNADFGGPFSASILPVRQYISWVQFSPYRNGRFETGWREDFNGTSLPSGWSTGDWESPLKLSNHDPRNVTFVNGIAVLSLTSDAATGFTGMPPADTGAGAGPGGAAGAGGAAAGAGAGGSASGGVSTGGRPLSTGGTAGAGGSSGTTQSAGGTQNSAGQAGAAQAGAAQAGAAQAGSAGAAQAGMTSGGAMNSAGSGNTSAGSGGAPNPMTTGGAAQNPAGSSNAGAGPSGAGGAGTAPDDSGSCNVSSPGPGSRNAGLIALVLGAALARAWRRRRDRTPAG